MSIRARRNSLLKSSISINTIRDSVNSFNDGLVKANNTASEIVQKTNDNNNFKRSLIGKDNEFFRRRRENVQRKAREDELEAASVQGVAARQGTVSSRSTKGFLGRIIDFFGIVLIGWFVTQLPRILEGIQKLIQRISKAVNILTGFIGGIQDFLTNFGAGISNLKGQMFNFDFGQQQAEAQDNLEKAEGGVNRLRREFFTAASLFREPGNFGLNSFNEGEIITPDGVGQPVPEEKQEQQTQETPPTNKDQNVQPKNNSSAIEENDSAIYKSVKQTKPPQEMEADDENIEGIKGDPFIAELESKNAQSKGTTIDQKNQEIKDEKEEKDEDSSLSQKLGGFMSNMFGTKAKREKDQKEGSIEGTTKAEEIASQFQGENQKLEASMSKFADSMKGKEGKPTIAPMKLNRENLVEDNPDEGDKVYLIEKPVSTGGGNSTPPISGSGGNKMQLNTSATDNQNIFKKIQKIILS